MFGRVSQNTVREVRVFLPVESNSLQGWKLDRRLFDLPSFNGVNLRMFK